MFSIWVLQLLETNFMSGPQSQRVLGALFKKERHFICFFNHIFLSSQWYNFCHSVPFISYPEFLQF